MVRDVHQSPVLRERCGAALRDPAGPDGLDGTGWTSSLASPLGFQPPSALPPPAHPCGIKLSSARCSVVGAGLGEVG